MPLEQRPTWLRHAGLGTELVGAVLGFTFLGIWIDRRFDTGPWGLLVCVFLGFVGGLYNLVKQALRSVNSSEPVRKPDDEVEG